MKKLLLSLLLIPFLLVGCKNNGKKSETKTDQYINVVVDEVSIMEEETYQIQTEIIKKGPLSSIPVRMKPSHQFLIPV